MRKTNRSKKRTEKSGGHFSANTLVEISENLGDKMASSLENAPERSTLVSVLAWIFILGGGFSTFVSILQNIIIRMMFEKAEFEETIAQAGQREDIPFFIQFIFKNFDLIFLVFLLTSVVVLISAVALLKRKNWARVVFIVLMSLGILWNILGVVFQFTVFGSLLETVENPLPAEFENMMNIIRFASVLTATAVSILLGFVIKKLCSPKIVKEFS